MQPYTRLVNIPACKEDAVAALRRSLLALTAGSLALYQALLWAIPGLTDAEPSFAGSLFPWVSVVTKDGLRTIADQPENTTRLFVFLAMVAGLFALYAVTLRAVKGAQPPRVERFVFGAGALFQVLYVFAPVMLSSDLYAYVVYGRAVSVYGENPYLEACPIPAGDPFMPLFGDWIPSWYGPLWTWLCAGLASLTGDSVGVTVLAFRLVAILAMLATSGVLWIVLRRMCPERAAQGLVFFMWNPLVVIETGLSGHNDGFMLAFLMLAFWLHLRGWKASAVLALTLSAMLKFVTGMLIPLYMLTVMRQAATWRERFVFAGRALALAAAALGAERMVGFADTGSVTAQSAFSADFYENHCHELIFNGLRRAFGEDAEDVALPRSFQGWWVKANSVTPFRAAPDATATELLQIPADGALLALAPHDSEWLRVFDPVSRRRGFVNDSVLDEIDRPSIAESDLVVGDLEKLVTERAIARKANLVIRLVTWTFMAMFGLLCAWRARDFPAYATWAAAAMLAALFLIITEIRPWYVNWALPLAALAPSPAPRRLSAMMAAGALTLYFSLSFDSGDFGWISTWRSIPAFIIPLAIFAVLHFRKATAAHAAPNSTTPPA